MTLTESSNQANAPELIVKLVTVAGPDHPREFFVHSGSELVIGRGSDSSTRIRDAKMSRAHCRLVVRGGRLELSDLGSLQGTRVNQQSIEDPITLRHGDEFSAGDTHFRVEIEDPLNASTMKPSDPVKEAVPKTLRELEGHVLLRYRLDKLVSITPRSAVFRAADLKRDRIVAVKVLSPSLTTSDAQRDRFIRAMRTMLPVRCANIVRLRQAGRRGPYCWAAMEWIDGISVSELIEQVGIAGSLQWKEVWRVAVHLCRALQTAARHNIIHRNVTPSNILRRANDQSYLLTDLVFARALEVTDSAQLTRPGDVIGELGYLAPERILDATLNDPRSDQFSLGATLYALLTGSPPIVAISVGDLISQIQTKTIEPPSRYSLGMDERLSDVVMRLLRKTPDQRFASADALMAELQRVGKYAGIEADFATWVG